MRKRKGIIFMTMLSAVLFCVLLITISLSPLADLGPNANQFGSSGMWISIGMILVFYLLPLIIYWIGIDIMRFVLALFCCGGLLINSTIIVAVLVIAKFKDISAIYIASITGLCLAAIIVNILWFFIAFRSPSAKNNPNQTVLP
ncbi:MULTISPECIES: DUF5391 family protein [unclassified Peribacillus]|uniref:DUF5391 family protein n=1 Tax=unclassified Peribacillus TaxID=2675266 RepID=UPI00191255C4|nr:MULTISPECIES: DUF5391 family protein [unclassified Peribacillus]MBK5484877.1 DUF5391 family protein [Peribacillus sp. TH16]MBK5499939.1 DUF5391 family protein [Peribacillus sp. TH14]WMX55009.1 DUF5391 family protein [Peribacillus sp. R9-11]